MKIRISTGPDDSRFARDVVEWLRLDRLYKRQRDSCIPADWDRARQTDAQQRRVAMDIAHHVAHTADITLDEEDPHA